MKNNTKVRLHLSKQLFESLTKQVLAETKMKKEALGGYTEVKMPKENKAAEKMTDKMQKMEEVNAQAATNKMSKIKEVNAQADTKKMQKMHEKMSSKEKMAKGMYKEDMGAPNQEKTVKITLDEYIGGDPGMYEVGKWACDLIPALKNLGTTGEDAQTYVDLGSAIVSLATIGTAVLGVTLAVQKDNIKAAAKKLISFVGGKKGVKEGANTDQELAQAVAKLPKDTVAKIAQKGGGAAPAANAGQNTLKEYEHHYEVRNGQCRRYNDEGDYEVVSMSYCR
jgi:rubrerythrin